MVGVQGSRDRGILSSGVLADPVGKVGPDTLPFHLSLLWGTETRDNYVFVRSETGNKDDTRLRSPFHEMFEVNGVDSLSLQIVRSLSSTRNPEKN